MDNEADSRFWLHFNEIIEELKTPPYFESEFYRKLGDTYDERIPIVESALKTVRELTRGLALVPIARCESTIWELLLLVLFYIDKFGRDIKVTAGELRGTEPVDPTRNQVDRLKQLVDEKGHDYNSGNISILSYFIWAEKSIVHEINKRASRLLSLSKAPDHAAKFENAPSTAFDLGAYAIFLLAYMRTFSGHLEATSAGMGTNGWGVQLATLCYVRREGQTLMLEVSEGANGSQVTYNALGGKVESGESPRACAMREVEEESGLIAETIALRGIVTITGVTLPRLAGRDWYILIYEVTKWSGSLSNGGPEGLPVWVDNPLLERMSFNPGDKYFLDHLDRPGWFEGSLRYTGSELTHAEFQHYPNVF